MEVRPGYKQTEVGVIPAAWRVERIVDVARQILDHRGRTPKKLGMDWGGGDIPALSAGNVKNGFIDFSTESYFGSEALYRRWMTQGDPAKDDIVFTTEAPLGNVALIPDDRKYILSQRTVLLKVASGEATPRFLYQLLRSDWFRAVLEGYASGSTAKGIQRRKFEQLPVVAPPLPEQVAIAGALGDADQLLDGLDRLIAKKRDLKQAAMQQLLTGRRRLPGFSGTWERVPLQDVSGFITKGSTPTTHGHGWQCDGVLFLRSECVSDEGLDLRPSMFISEAAHAMLRRSAICDGDILMTITGNVGRVVLFAGVGRAANINQHIARIRVDGDIAHPPFVFHYLSQRLIRDYYGSITTGQAYPQISLQQVRQTQVPLPVMDEQRAIAAVLSDMDAELVALEARRAKARALKQAMMQELLTGRIRLV